MEKMMELYSRTLNNCKFYEKESDTLHLIAEIGCLRGIAYCLETVGADFLELPELIHYINISRIEMGKAE